MTAYLYISTDGCRSYIGATTCPPHKLPSTHKYYGSGAEIQLHNTFNPTSKTVLMGFIDNDARHTAGNWEKALIEYCNATNDDRYVNRYKQGNNKIVEASRKISASLTGTVRTKLSSNTKRKISKSRQDTTEYHFVNVDTGEEVVCNRYELYKNWGASYNGVYRIIDGTCSQTFGWMLFDFID